MKTTLTIAAILSVGALVAYALPTQVFADESETNTEQKLAQENVGSGESTNFNCGRNTIESLLPIQACGTVNLGEVVEDTASDQ
jgi:hypothetical protein